MGKSGKRGARLHATRLQLGVLAAQDPVRHVARRQGQAETCRVLACVEGATRGCRREFRGRARVGTQGTPFLKSTATDGKGRRAARTWGTAVGKCQGRLMEVSAVPAEAAPSRPARGRQRPAVHGPGGPEVPAQPVRDLGQQPVWPRSGGTSGIWGHLAVKTRCHLMRQMCGIQVN